MPRLSGGRYARAWGGDAASLVDLIALAIVLRNWTKFHVTTGPWGFAIIAVLVVLPFIMSVWLSRHCSAWNTSVSGRCAKVRPRPFQRCEVHRAQVVTAHDVAAVVAFLFGLVAVMLLFA